jgi:hypothetical protein
MGSFDWDYFVPTKNVGTCSDRDKRWKNLY